MPEPTGYPELRFDETEMPTTVAFDGTTTIAQLLDPDNPEVVLAEGVARRRKGDRRDQRVGDLLAIGRMYADAGERLLAEAERRLS